MPGCVGSGKGCRDPVPGGAGWPRSAGSLPGQAGSTGRAACGHSLRFPRCCQRLARGSLTRETERPAVPPPRIAGTPAQPRAGQHSAGGARCPPGKAAERDPLPVSPKHLSRESPSRFSRPRAGVNHGPARRQGSAGGTRSAQAASAGARAAHSPPSGHLRVLGPVWSPGPAHRSQGPVAHPGARSAPPQVPGQRRCPHALASCGPTAPHAPTATPLARTRGQGPGTGQGGRYQCWRPHPTGAAASPTVRVLTPAPPHPAAGWEPQTEIPPVTAGPAPVTPGTRHSGYASRTRRQTRHSSGGTGATAPATAPAMGTAVPCRRRQQHRPALAAPRVPAGWILGGAGQPSGTGGPTSTV